MSFHIRPFQKADFDTLWRIDQVCFEPPLAYSRPELAIYIRRKGAFTLVAESEGGDVRRERQAPPKILGFIVAEARHRAGHIITIDVLPETRRAGVGSALLQAVEVQLRKTGTTVVELETAVDNAAAIQFYKRKGYFVEKTIPGYYANHLDALVMRKDLGAEPVERP